MASRIQLFDSPITSPTPGQTEIGLVWAQDGPAAGAEGPASGLEAVVEGV